MESNSLKTWGLHIWEATHTLTILELRLGAEVPTPQEVLGFHAEIGEPLGGSGAAPIYALAGCRSSVVLGLSRFCLTPSDVKGQDD